MLALLAVAFAAGMIGLSAWIGKRGRRSPVKDSPYECGMPPVGEGSPRFAVRFYLVAMLFILFDIVIVFLYPWAVVYREMLPEHPHLIFGAMLSFLGVLFVGYLYAVRKQAFNWNE
jgi:NADH-quinone oxidoreductase subunit A